MTRAQKAWVMQARDRWPLALSVTLAKKGSETGDKGAPLSTLLPPAGEIWPCQSRSDRESVHVRGVSLPQDGKPGRSVPPLPGKPTCGNILCHRPVSLVISLPPVGFPGRPLPRAVKLGRAPARRRSSWSRPCPQPVQASSAELVWLKSSISWVSMPTK